MVQSGGEGRRERTGFNKNQVNFLLFSFLFLFFIFGGDLVFWKLAI